MIKHNCQQFAFSSRSPSFQLGDSGGDFQMENPRIQEQQRWKHFGHQTIPDVLKSPAPLMSNISPLGDRHTQFDSFSAITEDQMTADAAKLLQANCCWLRTGSQLAFILTAPGSCWILFGAPPPELDVLSAGKFQFAQSGG